MTSRATPLAFLRAAVVFGAQAEMMTASLRISRNSKISLVRSRAGQRARIGLRVGRRMPTPLRKAKRGAGNLRDKDAAIRDKAALMAIYTAQTNNATASTLALGSGYVPSCAAPGSFMLNTPDLSTDAGCKGVGRSL